MNYTTEDADLSSIHWLTHKTIFTLNFLLGTPLNTLCFMFFMWGDNDSNSRLIHRWITLLDLITCAATIFPTINSFHYTVFNNNPILCNAYGIFWNCAIRLAIFLIAVLSCTRALVTVDPFMNVRKGVITWIVGGYSLFQLIQATIPFWFGGTYDYDENIETCTWNVRIVIFKTYGKLNNYQVKWAVAVFILLVQFIVPILVILVSGIVSCVSLLRKPAISRDSVHRSAVVTVSLLTCACLCINSPVLFVCYRVCKMNSTTEDADLSSIHWLTHKTIFTLNFLLGTPLNTLCFMFFMWGDNDSNSRLIHRWITLLDLITCAATIIPTINTFHTGVFDSPILCNIYGMFWNCAIRVAIFLIAGVITSIVGGYALLQLIQATIPFWFGGIYSYFPSVETCTWNIREIIFKTETPTNYQVKCAVAIFILLVAVQFIVPILVILVSGIVSCVSLLRKPAISQDSVHRNAVVTVCLLTCACLCTNSPYGFVICGSLYNYWFPENRLISKKLLADINIFVYGHSVALNSIANAIIYLVRIRKLRMFIVEKMSLFFVPIPVPPTLRSAQPVPEKLWLIQKYMSELQYDYTGLQFFEIRKNRPLCRLMDVAKTIIKESLPIKCLEAVILSIYLTSDLSGVNRFPIAFRSKFEGETYKHIVLGVYYNGRFGALGLSRRNTLMYKEMRFKTLLDLLNHYISSYRDCNRSKIFDSISIRLCPFCEGIALRAREHEGCDVPKPTTNCVPIPVPPTLRSAQPVPEKLWLIQKYMSELQYDYTGLQFFEIRKNRPLCRLMDVAKTIIKESLPIKCLEAVILSIYLTSDLSGVNRFPIAFRSKFEGETYKHIVLGVYYNGRFGALGLSRRNTLMYKEMRFKTLLDLLNHYISSYRDCCHTVDRIKLGLPVSHDKQSMESILWKYMVIRPGRVSNKEFNQQCDTFSRQLRGQTAHQMKYAKQCRDAVGEQKPAGNSGTTSDSSDITYGSGTKTKTLKNSR
eukprot:sb/3461637/